MSERMTKDVQVGRDLFENAEFYNYKGFADSMPKLEETKKEKLYYAIMTPWWRLARWIRKFCSEIRYAFQRMFNNYDSRDIWNVDIGFVDRYTKILTEYRKKHDGYPIALTEDEWNGIIDEMLYHLHYMSEDNVYAELEKQIPDGWILTESIIREIQDKHKDEFFALFSKYFYNLWY